MRSRAFVRRKVHQRGITAALSGMLMSFGLFCSGCSEPAREPVPQESCVEGLDLSCAPLYEPTFANIYERTLRPTCAAAGNSCHAQAGAKGGLVFEEPDATYALLLGDKGGPVRVKPNDPACSELVSRIESDDKTTLMPPGSPLPEAERCTIVQWIQNGAKR